MTQRESKLVCHDFQFRNWPGAGEEAAEHFGLSHAVILPANARTIIIGGELGIRDDGAIHSDLTEEVTDAFDHVDKAVVAAGLAKDAWGHVFPSPHLKSRADGKIIADVVVSTLASPYYQQ